MKKSSAKAGRLKETKGGRTGCRHTLRHREQDAIILARESAEKLGENHPAVVRLIELLIKIQRGDIGFTGRYVPTKLAACMAELRMHVSEAPKRMDLSGRLTLDQLVPAASGEGDADSGDPSSV